jgi:hypothetical protein
MPKRHRRSFLTSLIMVLAIGAATAATAAAQASPGDKVLILGPSVSGGAGSVEALAATAQGFTVDVVDEPTWSAMTTAQFAAYRAIIIGDNDDSGSQADIAAAENNAAVWGAAVTGNVMLSGADAEYHALDGAPGASKYIDRSIAFAAAVPGHTGAYVSLGGYYTSGDCGSPIADTVLDAFSPGGFTSSPCGQDDIHIDPATVPAPDGLTDADMSNWGTTTHNYFMSYPASFRVWAIGLDDNAPAPVSTASTAAAPGMVTTSDNQTGYPRFLVSERTPPVSTGATPGCSGALSVTNTDNAGGSGSKAIHYRVDGGAEQTLATTGNPGTASIAVAEGSHTVEYWGEDQLGNLEAPHNTVTVQRDTTAPVVKITSDQHTTTYWQGERATLSTVATDATSGLAQDPSGAHRRVSTTKRGRFTVTRTAVDKCGNRASATFRYRVVKAATPKVTVLGAGAAGRGCVRANLPLTVRTTADGLKSVRVTLDGRTIKRSKASRFRVTIRAAALAGGTHTVKVIADGAGGRTTRTIAFARCGGGTAPQFTG